LLLVVSFPVHAQETGQKVFEEIARFDSPEAFQAVGVDESYFYAINNHAISKYEKKTGKLAGEWKGPKGGPVIHLDSGVVVDGKLYCAHSNYPQSPMVSSVEIWDTKTMKHIGTHSFGIHWGSLTWIDRYNGSWWTVFANYNQVFGASQMAYGNNRWTTMVKFDDNWQWQEAWVLPEKLIPKFEVMSNSGGSWGPDGLLYLSGHDPAEVYVMKLPEAGSVLQWIDTIPLNIAGQGIAWDRSEPGTIYGIIRSKLQVTASKLKNINK
jgi:hypothetical protein